MERATVAPDQLLANSAWNLWEGFLHHAPLAVDELKRFWLAPKSSGRAILILDGLSLKELPIIVNAANERGIKPLRVEARGSQLPTETDRFAEALGVPNRSKLRNNQSPSTFIFGGSDVYTDVLENSFAGCVSAVTSHPHLVYWHTWPDEQLIHGNAKKEDALSLVATQIKRQLAGSDFWAFIDRVRHGRRLVITADHGYANSHSFSNEVQNPETIQLLRNNFRAMRNGLESPNASWPRNHLPPLVAHVAGHLAVVGQRKWSVQSGFFYRLTGILAPLALCGSLEKSRCLKRELDRQPCNFSRISSKIHRQRVTTASLLTIRGVRHTSQKIEQSVQSKHRHLLK